MSDKKLKIELLRDVEEHLTPIGFSFQKGKDRFARPFSDGSHIFHLVFLSGEEAGFRISPQVAIRVDEVERIFHLTSGFEKKFQADTPTLGSDAWRLQGGVETYITMQTREQKERTISEILDLFKGFALRYFEQFSDLKTIDNVLNSAPDKPCAHRIMDYLRAATGIIVAKLVRRPNYADLVEIYRQQMKRFADGFYLPNFEALASSLAGLGGTSGTL